MRILRIFLIFLTFLLILEFTESLKVGEKDKKKSKGKSKNKNKNKGNKNRKKNASSQEPSLSIKLLTLDPKSNKHVEISIPKNREIIVADGSDAQLTPESQLFLQCVASFPVQWIYSGDGFPEIVTNLTTIPGNAKTKGNRKKNNKSHKTTSILYVANAGLGLHSSMRESDTGEYTCSKVGEKVNKEFSSINIHVLRESLFVRKEGGSIYHTLGGGGGGVRIPCSVTHPDVVVTLQYKDQNGFLHCPSSELGVRHNPKSGFIVTPSASSSLEGKYICIGTLKDSGKTQIVEYEVKVESESERRKRRRDQMRHEGDYLIIDGNGNNAVLAEEDYNYFDDGNDKDFQDLTEHNFPLCNNSTRICGSNSICTISEKSQIAKCSCKKGFIGRPPLCHPECVLPNDCPSDMACSNHTCVNPCYNHGCGQGAVCTVIEHKAKCSCPLGYVGNPEGSGGKCGRSRVPPYPQYLGIHPGIEILSRLQTAMMIQQQNQGLRQKRFPCDPWPCGPNSECKPVGDRAHCRCSAGYVGRPPNCRPECLTQSDCDGDLACIESKCRDPCIFLEVRCGYRAMCRAFGHQPTCQCPPGFKGDPMIRCRRVQQENQQQQQGVQGPFPESAAPEGTPITPCLDSPPPCGKNALCSFRNSTVGCKCPTTHLGDGSDPYVECYPSPNNNPTTCEECGPLSKCQVMKKKPNGRNKIICSCLPGISGSPPNCRDDRNNQYPSNPPPSCRRNQDCKDEEVCSSDEGRCEHACLKADCGVRAICRGMRHYAICACKNAPDKDPLQEGGCPRRKN